MTKRWWLFESWGASLRAAMEYRGAFLTQALFMLANNFIFLAFWVLFFRRIPEVGGWTLPDVALCYGIAATSFGIVAVLLGGLSDLAPVIAQGGLDTWLLRPRSLLLQAAAARMRLSGFGDLVTGPILVVLAGHATPARLALFACGAAIGALVLASFFVACHAATFWIGRGEDLAHVASNTILSFALYPPTIFSGPARALLFTIVPAGLMSWLPAELVLRPSASVAGLLLLGAACVAGTASLIWRRGLRRYESGNLTQSAQA